MTQSINVPEGYVMDADGNMLLLANLPPQRQMEDDIVKTLFPKAIHLNEQIAKFKYESMSLIEEMIRELVQRHGIKKFEKIKGNISLVSIDGTRMIKRSIDNKLDYNSEIEVARQEFGLYINAIKLQGGSEAVEFIDAAFDLKQGKKINTDRLVELCNKNISHPLYKRAATTLRKSLFISGSKAYLNFYYRQKSDDEWTALPLQFSSVKPAVPRAPEVPDEPKKAPANEADTAEEKKAVNSN